MKLLQSNRRDATIGDRVGDRMTGYSPSRRLTYCLGGRLGLAACRATATAQGNSGLTEHAVDESVGAARLLRQRADARTGVVLLLELGRELLPCGARYPAALFQSLGHPC